MFHINPGDEGVLPCELFNGDELKGSNAARVVGPLPRPPIPAIVHETYAVPYKVNGVQIIEEFVLVTLFKRGGVAIRVRPKEIRITKFG